MKKYFLIVLFCIAILFLGNQAVADDKETTGSEPDRALENDMVLVPAGPFIFGTDKIDSEGKALSLGVPKPLYADENPKQNLFLKAFYIDRHEVTNKRYKAYIDSSGAVGPSHWENGQYPLDREDHPVTWVNWFDAMIFCQWAGKNLPTEKQWEKTARGQSGYEYPWGNEFSAKHANLAVKLGGKTKLLRVGESSLGASELGVQDLIGNVWEWVEDDYKAYKNSKTKSESFDVGFKVLRGQSASSIGHFPGDSYLELLKEFSRSGYRQFADPDKGAPDVGFRCASEKAPAGFIEEDSFSAPPAPASKTIKSESTSLGMTTDGNSQKIGEAESGGFNPFEVKSTLPQSGIIGLIVLSFVAGLFSFLSPCTLPILPAYFAITAQADRTRMSLLSFSFFCGLASLFVLMGASASLMGSVLRDYLSELTVFGGVLVVIFGIMTLFGQGFSGASFKSKPTATFIGYFLFGATFALGWTPCVGPILSGILILAASEKTIFQGMSLLFFYAVGLGLPLILIALFCSQLNKNSWFWRLLRGKGWSVSVFGKTLYLHTTNLFSGFLLIFLGVALAMGYLTFFNSLIPMEIQLWFSHIEEAVVKWFD